MMENYYTKVQLQEVLGVGSTTIERLMNDGELPYIRLRGKRGKLLFKRMDFEHYLENHTYNK